MDVCLGGCASVLRAEKRSASQFAATFQGAWSWQATRGRDGGRGSLRAKKRGIPVDSSSVGAPASQWQLLSPHLGPKGAQDPTLGRERRPRTVSQGSKAATSGFPPRMLPRTACAPVYPPLPAKDSRLVIALAAAKQSCSKRLTHAFQSQKILFEYFPAPSSALGRGLIARGLLRLEVVSQGVYTEEWKRLELPPVEEALSLPSHP